jgi:hypothetical protein
MKLAVVGSKCDLESGEVVEQAAARAWADTHKATYFRTSALKLMNIDSLFQRMGELVLQGT